jgi:HNH endonuclease
MEPTTKVCTRCPEGQNVKPVTEFFKNKGYKDGLYPYCKACHKAAESRPERVAKRTAYKAQYHLNHAATINARSVQWGKDHPERMREKNKQSKKKRLLEQVAAGEREMPKVYLNRLESLAAGEKPCSQCKAVKPLGEYYAWTQSPDGVQAECRDCHDGRYNPVYPRDTTIVEKACSQCGMSKAAAEFYDDPSVQSGIRGACKMCMDARHEKWGKANPEKRKTIANRWFQKAWHNPEKQSMFKTKVRAWRSSNPDKVRQHRRRDLEKNGRKPTRLASRRFHTQRFFAERPGYRRAASQKRRALLRGTTVRDAFINVWILYERDHRTCTLCSYPVDHSITWPDKQMATIDHRIPVTLGGEHSYANTKLAHHYCNGVKGNRLETPKMLARISLLFAQKYGTAELPLPQEPLRLY